MPSDGVARGGVTSSNPEIAEGSTTESKHVSISSKLRTKVKKKKLKATSQVLLYFYLIDAYSCKKYNMCRGFHVLCKTTNLDVLEV